MHWLTRDQARDFAARWLPAWTGNRPEKLLAFYSSDTFYLDPAVPEGLKGKPALRGYFEKLLARNPDWVWTQLEAFPMEDGFLNKWQADIPAGETELTVVGVCLVQLDDDGLIYRNEVYFDRSEWLMTLQRER